MDMPLALPIILTAMAFSIGGIIVGLGYAVNDRKLRELGTRELSEALFSLALIGIFAAFFAGNAALPMIRNITMQNASSFSCPGYMSQNYAICFAYNYLSGTQAYTFDGKLQSSIMSELTGIITELSGLAFILGILSSIKLSVLIISINLVNLFAPFANEIEYLITMLSAMVVGVSIQSAILAFAALASVQVLLPIGLLLRCLFISRKVGSFIIATGIGLYIIMPLSYLVDAAVATQFVGGANTTALSSVKISASGIESQYVASALSANSISGDSAIAGFYAAFQSLASQVDVAINSLLLSLSGFILKVFVMPAFNVVLTILSIREISSFLGGEASFGKFDI